MVGFLDPTSLMALSDPAVILILDLALKGTAALGVGLLGALMLRRGSASTRHLVLGLTFGSLLALPLLGPLLPSWEVEVPSGVRSSLASVQEAYVGDLVEVAPFSRAMPLAALPSDRFPLRLRLLAGWSVGLLALLVYFGLGTVRVRRLAAGARRVTNGRWLEEASQARRTLHVDRRVRLLQSDRATVPMTWGVFRPSVVLPAGAESWDPSLRRDVLLHEMAHVRRRDCLMQLAVRAACALYWFHPFVWWAAHEMRQLRERACDDEVLRAGSPASEYATHLLQVARSFGRPSLAQRASIAFARGPSFVGRVTDLLDGDRPRGSVRRPVAVLSLVTASLFVVPLAAITPWPAGVAEDCVAKEAPARLVHASFTTGDIVAAYDAPHLRLPATPLQGKADFTARGWCPVRFGQPADGSKEPGAVSISLRDPVSSLRRTGRLSLETVAKRPSPALPKPAAMLLACASYKQLEISASKT
jgi:beta-lactamase regulating signal transducer with metallopeptidase domain